MNNENVIEMECKWIFFTRVLYYIITFAGFFFGVKECNKMFKSIKHCVETKC